MKIKSILVASALLFSSVSHATIIYDDGLVHTIDSVVLDDIVIQNGSGLNIVQGGLIASSTSTAISSIFDTNVNMTGNATVLDGISGNWGNVSMAGSSLVAGGIDGIRNFEMRDNSTVLGGLRNDSSGALRASISGGQIIAGMGESAINGGIEFLHIDMSSGLLLGGYGSQTGGNGIAYGDWLSASISGGAVIGGNGGVSGGHAVFSPSDTHNFVVTGGAFSGGIGADYGGDALNLISRSSSRIINISGGEFNAGSGSVDDGWLLHLNGGSANAEITGGRFGYENVGNGIELSRGATLDVYGWNLMYEDEWLTGYLADGNWIQTFVSASSGNLNLHQVATNPVPEPPEILLFATGILGLFFARRKIKRGSSPVTS